MCWSVIWNITCRLGVQHQLPWRCIPVRGETAWIKHFSWHNAAWILRHLHAHRLEDNEPEGKYAKYAACIIIQFCTVDRRGMCLVSDNKVVVRNADPGECVCVCVSHQNGLSSMSMSRYELIGRHRKYLQHIKVIFGSMLGGNTLLTPSEWRCFDLIIFSC